MLREVKSEIKLVEEGSIVVWKCTLWSGSEVEWLEGHGEVQQLPTAFFITVTVYCIISIAITISTHEL
jgi:hypothetical protein